MDVGVVLPAYRPDPDRLVAYATALCERVDPAAVRVELDAADDATRGRLRDLPDRVVVADADRRRGKGAAVTAGFEALDTDILVFADADGSTPVDSLARVIGPVRRGEAALAVGSRRHPDATVASHQTFARRLLGDGFAWVARRVLDVALYDYQCGAKALTAAAWADARAHLREPGFAWDVELVAVVDALGGRVVEVPVDWEDQPNSTVSPVTDTLRIARGLLVARHRARRLRGDRLHRALGEDDPALVERGETAEE
jgi:glycosyltransferase involved in cell wall biosynthesis